jgi:putative peptidoglycan lipid II flippase
MNRRGIAVATAVIMVGTFTASVLGFVRAFVVARLFGAAGGTDAFFSALIVPQMFYDQIVGGAISAVLIPSFSRLAAEEDADLWLVVRTIMALVGAVVIAAVILLEVLAMPLMEAIVSGFQGKSGTLSLSVQLVRLALPAVLFSSLAAIALAALYSLHRRVVSAFSPSFYHLGIIAAAVAASSRWGIKALPVGAVAGAAVQLAVQLPVLLRARKSIGGSAPSRGWWTIDPNHPAVRRILRLYIPVAGGIVISIAGQVADLNFKSRLPDVGDLSAMQYATALVQFPVGIVAAALALAILPAISIEAARDRIDAFKDSLTFGLRAVVALMAPAMVGLMVLATPIAVLIYERGNFTHVASIHTATALLGYGPQLPFVGIDQLLIAAFYARHNTLAPALTGVFGVVIYVALAAVLLGPLSIFGLALANTIQIALHALILFGLLIASVGALRYRHLAMVLLKVAVSAGAMAIAAWSAERWISPSGHALIARILDVAIPGSIALLVYAICMVLLRVPEACLAFDAVRRRLTVTRSRMYS